MKTRTFLFILLTSVMFIFASALISAQQEEPPAPDAPPADTLPEDVSVPSYNLGDKMFSISLGMFVPLFFQAPDGSVDSTNLSLGGSGSLRFESFLNSSVAIGGEIAGTLSFSPNGRTFVLVPITGTVSYFFRKFPFEFPISLGAGLNFTKLDDDLHVEPVLRPAVSVYWIFNSEWSFGLNFIYTWIPQIYTGRGTVPADHTRFGNFLNINLSALYHF